MDQKDIKYYFLGIGGIGMSSLAKYLFDHGHQVMGYDKKPSIITDKLIASGIPIIFEDNIELIPNNYKKDNTKVVYTPAIPGNHLQYNYFVENGYSVKKRAFLLGEITKNSIVFAIAGTHGKTTTASFLSHLFESANLKFTAFIGGVLNSKNSNLINKGDKFTIVEADEYDRSFLHLSPDYGCITAMDADHLDVYGDYNEMEKAYAEFSKKITQKLIVASGLKLDGFTYSVSENANYYASNINKDKKGYYFDFNTPERTFKDIYLSIIGEHNLSNAICALSLMDSAGLNIEEALPSLANFTGVSRRMEVFNYKGKILIDDYAHHPKEIEAVLKAVKSFFKEKTNKVIFQPHLYTRTRDFMEDFAKILSQFDEVELMEIYPARELPINGVNSKALLNKITNPNKKVISRQNFLSSIEDSMAGLIVILGAGDISENIQELKKVELNEI